jgi:CRP/FNR family cyclic AMP-dependent transcriptional regulator
MLIENFINNKPDLANLFIKMPAEIREHCVVQHYDAKTIMIKKDAKPKYVYIISCGTLRIFNEFENGRILQTANVKDMDFIGLIEVLAAKDKIAATVETVTNCTALRIPKEDFLKWMEFDHNLAMMLAKKIAIDFYNISYSNGRLLLNSSMYTLVSFIIECVKSDIEQANIAFVNKKRQQIADELGISLRTVHRNVKKLKELGIIKIDTGKICVNSEQYRMLIDKLDELV